MNTLEIPGIEIDIDKLGEGIYAMMLEHPDSAALRYGMLINDVLAPLEKLLKDKIPDYYLIKDTGELIEDGKHYREEVLHAISSYCLERASKDGILIG